MQEPIPLLRTVSEVVSALGGTRVVMDITNASTSQVVTNWVSRNRFAHSTYLQVKDALDDAGLVADPMLWGIVPAEQPDECVVP